MTPQPWDFGRGLAGYAWRSPGARAAVLLTHGYAEYAERYVARYNKLIPNLVTAGLDVYAFDMSGHGNSPGARGVADVIGAVEDHRAARHVIATEGKPLFLFGHSLGGLVTAASVVAEPEACAGVVLSAPALLIEALAPTRWLAHALAAVAPSLSILPKLPANEISRIPEEVAAYDSDPMISRQSLPMKLASTAVRTSRALWPRYQQWRTPTLVLHGEADRMTDPLGSKRFIDAIIADDRTLTLYPGARHELLNDLTRDEALEAVLSWLKARL